LDLVGRCSHRRRVRVLHLAGRAGTSSPDRARPLRRDRTRRGGRAATTAYGHVDGPHRQRPTKIPVSQTSISVGRSIGHERSGSSLMTLHPRIGAEPDGLNAEMTTLLHQLSLPSLVQRALVGRRLRARSERSHARFAGLNEARGIRVASLLAASTRRVFRRTWGAIG
jgi:hypothetical protein